MALPLVIGAVAFYSVVRYVLFSLGIGLFVYVGLNELLNYVITTIGGTILALPSDVLNILGLFKIDIALNSIATAYAIRVSLLALKTFKII